MCAAQTFFDAPGFEILRQTLWPKFRQNKAAWASRFSGERELRIEEAQAIQQWFREQWLNSHPNCKKLYRTLDSLRRRRGIKGKLDEEDPSLKTSSKLKECEACLDFVVEEAFPQQKITSSCAHELTVCNHCVATSVDIQIQEARLQIGPPMGPRWL
jgi:hypothetical protein